MAQSGIGYILSRMAEVWAMVASRQGSAERILMTDMVIGTVLAVGTVVLFWVDITQPRGVVDGIGYAAIVALSSRFGARVIVGSAIITTLLTFLGAWLVPDAGVYAMGMWANRSFALLDIWIVGGILLHRLKLGQVIEARSHELRAHQHVLAEMVRSGLQPDKLMNERVCSLTEIAAGAIGADFCGALQGVTTGGVTRVRTIDNWDARTKSHSVVPDVPVNDSPGYEETLETQHVVYADDVFLSPMHQMRLPLFQEFGIRAVLAAAPFGYRRDLGAIFFGFGTVHHWTEDERAFAIAAANLVALVFSSTRATETLAALDLVDEGIYVVDAAGELRYANRAARNMAGLQAIEDPAKFPAPAMPLTRAEDQHTVTHGGRELEIQRLRLPAGEVLTRINDVTIRNAALADRQHLESRLQQAAKMEAIGQLAGGVAHDFNNILGSILGFAGFLAEDLPEGSQGRGYAERILRAANRGKGLVDQTLTFANTRSVEQNVVDLASVLDCYREAYGDLCQNKAKLVLQIPDTPMLVKGNAVQIHQLVANLCMNARDVVANGNGTVEIRAALANAAQIDECRHGSGRENERLIGEFSPETNYCRVSVCDNGPGIAPDILDRIFEPFFTTKGRHRGTGLGLAVVHGVVKSHNAVLHVRSEPGHGACFTAYFPLAAQRRQDVVLEQPVPATVRGSERVLVVDDEPDLADALVIGFERLGYQAVCVNHPHEGLAAITEDPDAFDVLVTDELMPDMRGQDLIRQVKTLKPSIKAVLCTGHSTSTNAETAKAAGADIFFYKPVDVARICASLRPILDTEL